MSKKIIRQTGLVLYEDDNAALLKIVGKAAQLGHQITLAHAIRLSLRKLSLSTITAEELIKVIEGDDRRRKGNKPRKARS